jgi:hypothetical protein
MSGTTLGGRCSPFRGQTVLASSVLNVSYRQLRASTLASETQESQQHQTAPGFGAPLGPNGQGQLQNAPVPPPLRGSFRGAVSGQGAGRGGRGGYANGQSTELPFRPNGNGGAPRGPRGRGRGAQRGGYVSVENSNPSEGIIQNNPNFRPQNYTSVPPPQGLERGRGRGRGRGNGTGFRGRGRGGQRGGASAVNTQWSDGCSAGKW